MHNLLFLVEIQVIRDIREVSNAFDVMLTSF